MNAFHAIHADAINQILIKSKILVKFVDSFFEHDMFNVFHHEVMNIVIRGRYLLHSQAFVTLLKYISFSF